MRVSKLVAVVAVMAVVVMMAAGALAAQKPDGPTVIQPQLAKYTVTSPSGGEQWNAGKRYDIAWTPLGNPNYFADVFLQKGNGTPVQIAWKVANGKANCLIPASTTPGNDYRILVVSTNNALVRGVSNTFTVNPPPTIHVTSPNGGEVWNRGGTYNITWTYTGNMEKVTIMLVPKDDPVKFRKLAEVSPGVNGTGSYSWKIPADVELRSDYRIWVSYSGPSIGASDQNFTIRSLIAEAMDAGTIQKIDAISVEQPAAGSVLQMGNTYQVSWKPFLNPNLQGPVKVQLMLGDLVRETLSHAGGEPLPGSMNWKIFLNDMNIDPGATYRIKVTSLQNDNLHGYSGAFKIIKPTITVTSPAEWTELRRGQTYTIHWTTTGDCGATADIFLTIWSNLTVVDTIAANIPLSQGSFTWTMPMYDDAKMDMLKPNGWITVQATTNPDIHGGIRVTAK